MHLRQQVSEWDLALFFRVASRVASSVDEAIQYEPAVLLIERVVGDVDLAHRLKDAARLPVDFPVRLDDRTELAIVPVNAVSATDKNKKQCRDTVVARSQKLWNIVELAVVPVNAVSATDKKQASFSTC